MSRSDLTEQFKRARAEWPFIDDMEKLGKLPAKLLYAVGWRETRLQNIMGDYSQRPGEPTPRHHGFGVWQRDSGTFGVDQSYLRNVRRQAEDAAELLLQNFRMLDDWAAAIAAYNCGPGRVQTAVAKGLSPDHFTTGRNYSADVLATRKALTSGRPPRPRDVTDPTAVPARAAFRPGRSHPNFTLMGERFRVWLKDEISHDGNGYTPGPEFSTFDRENIRRCQILMGDEPDGWFGQSQWERLTTERPPKRSHVGACPVTGLRMTQRFGNKNSMYAAGEHTGVDFGASGDDTIRCTADGVVVRVSYDSDGWGRYVIVQHAGKRFSWYCHLARTSVDVGDRVERGHVLGVMGSTGNSSAKHLHYQETLNGTDYRDYTKPILLPS